VSEPSAVVPRSGAETPDAPAEIPDVGAGTSDVGAETEDLPGGSDYGRLAGNLRHLLDVVAGARPPAEVVTRVASGLGALSAELEPFVVPESQQVAGHREDLAGRGQTMIPAVIWDERDSARVECRTTFGRHFLGGGGAAHGGAVTLLFDEVLGLLANVDRPMTRTAYLNVTFRAIAPIEVELRLDATVDRQDGRKWFLSGRLYRDDVLCADAEGLFVELRPGQP
jgi:acyl-coenzyme A thioesterase PaaI-like protein